MASDQNFVDFVVEQLQPAGDILAKKRFRGIRPVLRWYILCRDLR